MEWHIDHGPSFRGLRVAGGRRWGRASLDAVADNDYIEAQETAEKFEEAIDNLPSTIEQVSLDNAETINSLGIAYDGFSDKVKSFIDTDHVTALKQYILRIADLQKAADSGTSTESGSTTTATT